MQQLHEDKQSILATVSLLSASTGLLKVLALPSGVSPDWLVPDTLVLDVLPMTERQVMMEWEYNGRKQDVPVYSLVGEDDTPEQLIILESMTDVYRVGLLVSGNPVPHSVRISELKDVDDKVDNPYCLQAVRLEGELTMVPDLDKLSKGLVDLD